MKRLLLSLIMVFVLIDFGYAANDIAGQYRIIKAVGIKTDLRKATVFIGTDGRIAAFSGCNRMMGQAEISAGNTIKIGPMAMTKMACEESLMKADYSLHKLLGSVTRWKRIGKTLHLQHGQKLVLIIESTRSK
jgi:heat shock protein HslJ